MMHIRNSKDTVSQSARLVKDHIFDLGKGFQIVGALDEDALPAGTANPGKKAQRHADNQSTWAADNQEQKSPVYPHMPCCLRSQQEAIDKGRQHRQCQGAVADQRRIDTGKLGDKRLGF